MQVAGTEENPTNDFYLTALNHVTDRPEFRSLLDDCGPLGELAEELASSLSLDVSDF